MQTAINLICLSFFRSLVGFDSACSHLVTSEVVFRLHRSQPVRFRRNTELRRMLRYDNSGAFPATSIVP